LTDTVDIPVAYMCAHCWLFTSQSAWQGRVECSGLSGVNVYWTGPLGYWWCHIILCGGPCGSSLLLRPS